MGKRRKYTAVLKDDKESYKHAHAKAVLMEWLGSDARQEVEFINGGWRFIVDVVDYAEGHIQAFYEVTHTHPVDGLKLAKMQYYCYVNNLDVPCYEVEAEYILRQVEKPEKIEKFTYELNPQIYAPLA